MEPHPGNSSSTFAANSRPLVPLASRGNIETAPSQRYSAPGKRKRVACRECRQGKLRCESTSLQQVCIRCRDLGLSCVYDNDYKRHNKRVKLRELAEEVERLRAAQPHVANISPPALDDSYSPLDHEKTDCPVPASYRTRSGQVDSNSSPLLTDAHFREPQAPAQVQLLPAVNSQTLGNVTLTSSQIDRLFQTFFSQYHPFMPFVETDGSPDDYYTKCPLLFWTIIAIASRRDEEEPTMLTSLSQAVQDLLWLTVPKVPHSRLELKAMILLCLWPFPTSSMSTDPSYILASVAKTSAMHIGLHKPYFVQDFSRVKFRFSPEELRDALLVWSACFIAAENITSYIGQFPLFVTDATLDMICTSDNHGNLPLEIYHMVLITRFCNRFHRVMASRERRMASLGENDSGVLLPLYESELKDLRWVLGPDLSKTNEIVFLYATLQLRSYYFLERSHQAAQKEYILKAYRAALNIIWKCQEREAHSRLLTCGPKIFTHALSVACNFALKVLRSGFYSQFVDVDEGRKAFNLGISQVRKCSIEDNDLPGRYSKILAQLWGATAEPNTLQPELRVRSRLGASLLHDTLWKWRENFGGQPCARTATATQCENGNTSSDASLDINTQAICAQRPGEPSLNPDPSIAQIDTGPKGPNAPMLSRPTSMWLEEIGEMDMGLVDENNNQWFWNQSGISTLMATDLDDMELHSDYIFNTQREQEPPE
ncbi:Fungal Zn2-Cys6 binuclear cluster domain-containing protein [Cladophialophora immunda]|nr:Fungal Zn2-Cys6 binuclear cluster domain-containing protein [Cladophialophora immunda]